MILKENGISLLYKEEEKSSAIKGEINIGEILSVLKKGDKRFNINCLGRIFEMETKSIEECNEWVKVLSLL